MAIEMQREIDARMTRAQAELAFLMLSFRIIAEPEATMPVPVA